MSPASFTQSILFRLTLFGLAMILVGSTVRYFIMSDFLRQDITNVVSQQQMSLANYVANDIAHKILVRQYRLQELGSQITPDMASGRDLPAYDFGKSAPFEALFSGGVLLTDPQGRVISNKTTFEWKGSPLSLIPDAALKYPENNAIYIGKPVIIPGQVSPMFPMTLVLANADNQPWAYLTGFTLLYSPDFLGNLLQARLGLSGSGFLVISPEHELFIAASNRQKVLTPTPPAGVNLLHDKAMQGYRGTGITTNAQGIEEIAAIVSIPNTDWFLVSAIATSEALGTVERLRQFLLRNTLITLVALFAAIALIVPISLRPLTRATRQSDKMARGLAPLEPLSGAGKGEVGVLISAFNRLLGKLQEQQAELTRAAHHDSLTGLPNRRLLSERVKRALANARRQKNQIALLFLDLDEFKPINDTLGHEAGDKVLQLVAQRLLANVRETDSVARLGGDEFVILLTGLDNNAAQTTEALADKIMAAIKTPFELEGATWQIGTSIGAVVSNGEQPESTLMRLADNLMYEAKAAGRGRCVVKKAGEAALVSNAPVANHPAREDVHD